MFCVACIVLINIYFEFTCLFWKKLSLWLVFILQLLLMLDSFCLTVVFKCIRCSFVLSSPFFYFINSICHLFDILTALGVVLCFFCILLLLFRWQEWTKSGHILYAFNTIPVSIDHFGHCKGQHTFDSWQLSPAELQKVEDVKVGAICSEFSRCSLSVSKKIQCRFCVTVSWLFVIVSLWQLFVLERFDVC